MINILHIDSSSRIEDSFSRKYTKKIVDLLLAKYTDTTIFRRDIGSNPPSHISEQWFSAAYTESSKRSFEQKLALAESEVLVDELLASDIIVLGSPMYNYTITCALKTYIDQICRSNRTFNAKYEGLAINKKAYIVASRGGSGYEIGEPFNHMNFHDNYLIAVLKSIGIIDINFIKLNGTLKGADVVKTSYDNADKIISELKL